MSQVPGDRTMKHRAIFRLNSLKRQLNDLYFTSEYERLKNVISSIRSEINRKHKT